VRKVNFSLNGIGQVLPDLAACEENEAEKQKDRRQQNERTLFHFAWLSGSMISRSGAILSLQ
jgi:hypothetical protein